ncbi:hypothetical protein JVT61DRAFT_14742 [Boletus reticuloceps]|uniref:F-box domain-containing protein n=1 Tax=Boletus reticuloceps TaxID=495285 RepID=A0A8I3AAF1_9AGAM|nr:hypothetical protein JVT61DRAFT_14742 [Boletus reticuloceps]
MTHNYSDSVQPDDLQLTKVEPTTISRGYIALPAETLHHILHFLGPLDLIRLQAVSKVFHEIIHDPEFWRTVYATASLPLPSGPFNWQSIHFLQRALVHSTRLARTWTTEPLTLISRKVFTGPRTVEDDRFKWVHGRWLIVSKDMKQLRSRDIETGSEQVLWDHGSFAFWAATWVMNSTGHFIYIAVHLGKGHVTDPVKLLEFVVDDDTEYLSGPEMIDVPTWALSPEAFIPRIRVDSGIAPYAYVSLCSTNKPRQSLIFDPRYRRFYKFPSFRTQIDLLLNYRGAWLPHLVEVYFTRTYLFVLNRSYLIHGNVGHVEVLQVFAFPDIDSDPGPSRDSASDGLADSDTISSIVYELRLTHEILTRDTRSMWLAPIRDAFVDPITTSTTLRFMHTTEEVLPITIVSHDVFSVRGVWNGNLLDASKDGFVRGLCMVGFYADGSVTPNIPMVYKFTVDATGERCVAVIGDPSPPWAELEPARHYEYTMDGMRGRLWHTKGDVLQMDSSGQPVDKDVLAVVADFK